MFLNVGLCAGGATDPVPKTPEILNSLMSLSSPPFPPACAHYQGGTSELLSPEGSTPGEETGKSFWSTPSDPPPIFVSMSTTSSSSTPSTSLLTPTSDDSPPPLPSFSCAPDLPSPVNTVEATRSALIKEGLKLQITSKLQQNGLQSNDLLKEETKVIKSELTSEDEDRRRKRRERNKLAATKCRNKKKEKTCILITEAESVEDLNARLKSEYEKLTAEKEKLERCLNDAKHKATCNYIPKPTSSKACSLASPSYHHSTPSTSILTTSASPLHSVPTSVSPCYASPTSSSSSYCSSSSPCSFNSLLSPSDNKDFVASLIPPPPLSDNFNTPITNLTSVPSTSLDYIEPTIPLDPPSSPSKLLPTKCKASPRYHPYNIYPSPCSSSLRNDSPYSGSMPMDNTMDSKNFDPADQSYTFTTLDIKTNPFTYPSVSDSHQEDLEMPNYTPLEVAKLSQFRDDKCRTLSGAASLSRYSSYSINQQGHETLTDTSLVGCNQYQTGIDLEYFPPCSYSSL